MKVIILTAVDPLVPGRCERHWRRRAYQAFPGDTLKALITRVVYRTGWRVVWCRCHVVQWEVTLATGVVKVECILSWSLGIPTLSARTSSTVKEGISKQRIPGVERSQISLTLLFQLFAFFGMGVLLARNDNRIHCYTDSEGGGEDRLDNDQGNT